MKTNDGILIQLGIYCDRALLFIFITGVLSALLWFVPLWYVFHVRTVSTLLSTTVLALTRENLSAWLLMRFAFYLAFSLTSILYLSLALWWKRSGQQHRRGSQLVDRGY